MAEYTASSLAQLLLTEGCMEECMCTPRPAQDAALIVETEEIRTVDKYPADYAETQNNLGVAYRNLAEVRDREENIKKANFAFEEALKIYTIKEYPFQHNDVISNMEKAKQISQNKVI